MGLLGARFLEAFSNMNKRDLKAYPMTVMAKGWL
jgi:hypothetical protein